MYNSCYSNHLTLCDIFSSASGGRERATSIFVVDQRDGRVERLLLRLSSLLPGQGKPGGCGHFPCLSYQTGGHLRQ